MPPAPRTRLHSSCRTLYPPLLAELLVPFTFLPNDVAAFLALLVAVGSVLGALAVVGVRDVRCYAAVVIWAPGWNAFEMANVTAVLALAVALVWRYRDSAWPSAGALGASLVLKLFLWPLLVWAAVTHRVRLAAGAVLVGASVALVSWAVIGFAGFTSFPDQLGEIEFAAATPSSRCRARSAWERPRGMRRRLWLARRCWRPSSCLRAGETRSGRSHARSPRRLRSPPSSGSTTSYSGRAARHRPPALLRLLAPADSPVGVSSRRERRRASAVPTGARRDRPRMGGRRAQLAPHSRGGGDVTSGVTQVVGDGGSRQVTWSRVGSLAAIAFFGVLPALAVAILFTSAIDGNSVAIDFGQYYAAAEAILRGESPYRATGDPLTAWGGPYPYPPLLALLAAPLTALSLQAAGLVVMAALVLVALSVPWILGVRDWRCYGLLLLWPPVISAIQTGNVTLWFALAAALAWRFRDRVLPVSAVVGLTLAAKFFLWPLVIWLAATRRVRSAIGACVVGGGMLVASWAALGFAGFLDYPELLRKLEDTVGGDSYTAYIVGLDLGFPSGVSRAIWLGIGLGILCAVLVLARRGDERTAFIVAIAASLALTPIVWLHYFALLLVVVALAQPRLGLIWFVPLAMILTPGSGQPTPFQTSWTLAVALVTVGWAVRRVGRRLAFRGVWECGSCAGTFDCGRGCGGRLSHDADGPIRFRRAGGARRDSAAPVACVHRALRHARCPHGHGPVHRCRGPRHCRD